MPLQGFPSHRNEIWSHKNAQRLPLLFCSFPSGLAKCGKSNSHHSLANEGSTQSKITQQLRNRFLKNCLKVKSVPPCVGVWDLISQVQSASDSKNLQTGSPHVCPSSDEFNVWTSCHWQKVHVALHGLQCMSSNDHAQHSCNSLKQWIFKRWVIKHYNTYENQPLDQWWGRCAAPPRCIWTTVPIISYHWLCWLKLMGVGVQ